MEGKTVRWAVVLLLALVIGLLQHDRDSAGIVLARPAHAAPATTYLDQEAGVAAYAEFPEIDLRYVRALFRTVELETDSYIVGSVPLAGYYQSSDVHVYIHEEGWVIAYYLAGDPAAKSVDLVHYDGGTSISTKLESAITRVAEAIQLAVPPIGYYDYRHPEANRMMIIADRAYSNSETFRVRVPEEFVILERSFALGTQGGVFGDGFYYLDSTLVARIDPGWSSDWYTVWGTVMESQLLPGLFHTVTLEGGPSTYAPGTLVLVYRQ